MSPGAGELGLHREYLACDPVRSRARRLAARARAGLGGGAGAPGRPGPRRRWRWATCPTISAARSTACAAGRPAASEWPPLEFRFYDAFWVSQPAPGRRGEIWAVDAAAAGAAAARLAAGIASGRAGASSSRRSSRWSRPSNTCAAVERVLEYLRAGDVYQVNLARRLRARCRAEGPAGPRAVRPPGRAGARRPSRCGWPPTADGRALVGNSPERFLRRSRRRRDRDRPHQGDPAARAAAADDDARARELLAAPKDRAEHVMIVDLERNDLGRICQTGSVRVEQPLRLLSLPSVHHLVSTVRGQLRPGLGLEAILRATFPGGSITGAPKLRAMEIIDELEPACRGPYTGATGWLGAAGDFDLAVAIRTALLEDETLTLWVGGGIVADSSPEAELEETAVKARAFAGLTTPHPG